MKKLFTLIALCLGMSTGAWADWSAIHEQNFENGTITGWTITGGTGTVETDATPEINKYAKFVPNSTSGNRGQSYGFSASNISAVGDTWKIEFDAALTKGADRTETSIAITSAKTGDITTNNAASGSLYFLIKQSANGSTTYNVYLGSSTNAAAGSVVLADNTFTHFTIVYQDGTLSATIGSNATISDEISSETVGALKGLKTAESRNAGVVRIDNITLSKYLEAGTVAAPTFNITGVNGVSRTLTLASTTDGATFKWSETAPAQDEDFSTWTATTETVTTSAATIYAVAIKGSNVSEVSTIETGAGVGIKLNTPTYVKGAYNSATQETAITLNATQSVLLNPVASVVYSIDGGAETTVASGTVVNVPNDATLTWYAISTGYTNSDNNEIVVKAPAITGLVNAWSSVDYVAVASEDKGGITTNVLAQNVNGTDYFQLVSATAGALDADKVSVRPCANGWMLRNANRGLYNSNATGFAIANLHAGDVVVFDGAYGNGAFSMSNGVNSVVSAWDSTNGVQYVYNITADGTATFELARYAFVKRIRIYTAPTTPVNISAAGYATFVTPYAVDFTDNAIEAFYVSDINANTVTLTKATQVPAGEAVIVKGESGNVNVIASAEAINNFMQVATEAIDYDENDEQINYVLAQGANGVGLYPVNEGTIAAGKGYLPVLKSVAAKDGFTFVTDDVTAANVVKAAPAVVKNGKFATADGIVIVKDGVKYNVAGMKK